MLKHKTILSLTVVTVLCILLGGLEAQAVTTDSNVFPVQGGIYKLEGPTTVYPGARPQGETVDIELVSMSLTNKPSGSTPPVVPPPEGQKFVVDSFFDISFTFEFHGEFNVDSFFDIFTELSIENPTGGAADQFDIEIVSMDLSGPVIPIPGTTSNLEIRLSPTIPSVGWNTIADLGADDFAVDSFFDVFTELRVDGGDWKPASGAVHMNLIPEPATLGLLLGGLVMICHRRR